MAKIPVIFLAFANDRVDTAAYLRNLPKELHGIRDSLETAIKEGLCELVERANATVDTLLDVFQDSRYRDRIAIFHYGGHANGYQLLLEGLDGSHSSAHSVGLVSFLARQTALQLVFLNGCSSQQQALDLVNAGLPAVIGTSQSINDDIATMLSIRFYQALGNGASIERAWNESVDQVKIQKGTSNMRDLFWDAEEDAAPSDQFPWDINFREGAEIVRGWNLPESAGNPLFGLPSTEGQYDLPEEPYCFLQRYTRANTEIFFGRSYSIRDLYNSAVNRDSAPVLLFYGQSGVGKSSMLDAGLFPRLEQSRQVVYVRRQQSSGLLGTLRQALGLEEESKGLDGRRETQEKIQHQIRQLEAIKAESAKIGVKANLQTAIEELQHELRGENKSMVNANAHHSLKETWNAIEQKYGRPLIILLDQVEECFTHPNEHLKNEFQDFFDAVRDIFFDKHQRPMGKLILSYRKEYNPEIKGACVERSIPREEIFLKALDRKDIVEIVKGLTLNERLRRNYRLEVEETLPVIIADDLLEDKDSPVAPVLQILLTKLWKMTENEEKRLFNVDRYQQLRKQGVLMDDFFQEQMMKLEKSFPEEVSSGLVLGLLQRHTTRLGTAGSRTLEELRELYADRQEVIDRLVVELKDLYLLTSSNAQMTGLAHDTLAPLVLQMFRNSAKPAQLGSIILDNKLVSFQQDEEKVIDPDDLRIIEDGIAGMPLFTRKEQELIDKSRKARDLRIAQQKRIRRLGIAAVTLIVCTAVFAFFQMRKAQQQERVAASNMYAAKASQYAQSNPVLRLQYAKFAYQTEPENMQAVNSLISAYNTDGMFYDTLYVAEEGNGVYSAFYSPDGSRILTAEAGGAVKVFDSQAGLLKTYTGHKGAVIWAAWSQDGLQAVSTAKDSTVFLWDSEGNGTLLPAENEPIAKVAFSPDGKHIAGAGLNGKLYLWGIDGELQNTLVLSETALLSVAFAPDGNLLVGGDSNLAGLFDLNGNRLQQFGKPEEDWKSVYSLESSQDGAYFISAGNDTTAQIYNREGGAPLVLRGHARELTYARFAPDGQSVFTASFDRTVKQWTLTGKLLKTFSGHDDVINTLDFTSDTTRMLTASGDLVSVDNSLRAWPLKSDKIESMSLDTLYLGFTDSTQTYRDFTVSMAGLSTLEIRAASGKVLHEFRHSGDINSFAVSADGRIVTAAEDYRLRMWSIEGEPLAEIYLGMFLSCYDVRFSEDGNYILYNVFNYNTFEEYTEKRLVNPALIAKGI